MSLDEKRPFLDDDDDNNNDNNNNGDQTSGAPSQENTSRRDRKQRPTRPSQRILHPVVAGTVLSIAIIFLVANVWLLVILIHRLKLCPIPFQHPYSPAEAALHPTLLPVHNYTNDSPYVGPPSPTFDTAWSELLSPFNIKLSAQDLREANQKSFRVFSQSIPASSEIYLGYLEVYHHLHCLKLLIQIRHRDHYPDLVASGMLTEEHFGHCVQALQHALMCHADVSLSTWTWDGDDAIFSETDRPLSTRSKHVAGSIGQVRQCVNWERLDGWARDRSIGWDYELKMPDQHEAFGPDWEVGDEMGTSEGTVSF